MNLNQLYYFQVLAKHEHYTNAAEELHIAQPTLSKAMASLEEELGAYLFEKKGRNIILTKQGKHYLEYVNAALSELERGNDYLRKEHLMAEGYIDLGMVTSVEYDKVPEWIKSFRESHEKNIFFSCKTGTSQELVHGLMNNQFDLIFCTAIMGESQIQFIPVFEQHMVVVVPAYHHFAARKSLHIKELEPENIIIHTRSSSMWEIASQIYREAGVTIRVAGEAEEDRTIVGLIRAGIGCAIMTESPGIYNQGVSVIPLTGIHHRRYICMGYRKDQARSQMAELFRKHIMEAEFVSHLQEQIKNTLFS